MRRYTKQIMLSVTEDTYKKLKQKSQIEQMTIGTFVRHLLIKQI